MHSPQEAPAKIGQKYGKTIQRRVELFVAQLYKNNKALNHFVYDFVSRLKLLYNGWIKVHQSFAMRYLLLLLSTSLLLSACISRRSFHIDNDVPLQASGVENGCDILNTHEKWRASFKKTYEKYGVPPHVVMAIIYQESRFVHDAKSPTSTAFGYPQAKTETWDWYRDKSGNNVAYRDYLPDAVDFIGWYLRENHRRTQVSKWDARTQYLAYHEGTGGYLRHSHLGKTWLLAVADKVGMRAKRYRHQLQACFHYPKP